MFPYEELNKKDRHHLRKVFSLMINDHQSTMDKMLDTLNEKATYQQCIEGVLPELDKFVNGYSRNVKNKVFDLR